MAKLTRDEQVEAATLRGVVRLIDNTIKNSEEQWGYQDAAGRNALRDLKVIINRNRRHPGEIRRDLRCSRSTP